MSLENCMENKIGWALRNEHDNDNYYTKH